MITPEPLEQYCDDHSFPESDVLTMIKTETPKHFPGAHMICGPQVSGVLQLLISSSNSKMCLDIGTYTGYSAVAMAEVLPADGKVLTIEKNLDTSSFAQKMFEAAGVSNKIDAHVGSALEIIKESDAVFDFVFIDADKAAYIDYVDLCLTKMKPGGIIVADDVLWRGEVLDCTVHPRAKRLHTFNEYVASHPKLKQVVLPIRHGLNVMTVID